MHDDPQPALVLARWNSWVRVFLPDTGETRWIDLTALDTWAVLEDDEVEALAGR